MIWVIESYINLIALEKLKQLTMQATSANAWRREGIYYKKNNIYIDVVETTNVVFSSKGTVLKTDVSGSINVKCELSGMPECKFGMNDKLFLQRTNINEKGISIDDTKFHQCVKLNKFDKVSFIIVGKSNYLYPP